MVAVLRAPLTARAWRRAAYVLIGVPAGIAYFVVVAVGLAVGFGSIVGLVGIPILVLTLAMVRLLAAGERGLARRLLGVPIQEPPPAPPDEGLFTRVSRITLDPGTWRATGFLLLKLPVAILAAGLLAWPTFAAAMLLVTPIIAANTPVVLFGWEINSLAESLLAVPIAITVGWITLTVCDVMGAPLGRMAEALLGPSAEDLRRAVAEEQQTRARMVATADAERRRIERAIHDGAQQRIVSLGLQLGMIERALDRDPRRARQLLGTARGELAEALRELRELARGLHPTILSERGLPEALEQLATRSPVPVAVRVERPPARPGRSNGVLRLRGGVDQHGQARRRGARRSPHVARSRDIARARARRRRRRRRSNRLGAVRPRRPGQRPGRRLRRQQPGRRGNRSGCRSADRLAGTQVMTDDPVMRRRTAVRRPRTAIRRPRTAMRRPRTAMRNRPAVDHRPAGPRACLRGVLLALPLAMAALAVSGCGNGPRETVTRSLPAFDRIDSGGDVRLSIRVGAGRPGVAVTAGRRRLDDVRTEVRDGVLKIDADRRVVIGWIGGGDVDVAIEVPRLRDLSLDGSADADVSGLDGGHLRLSASGSADVEATGRVDDLTVDVSGSGDFRLFGLRALRADVAVSGSGDVEVDVADRLDARIAGSADITYRGDPRVESRVSGSGDVTQDR